MFVNSEGAGKHLQAGAKKVLLQLSFNPCMYTIGGILGMIRLLTCPDVLACWPVSAG